MPGLVTLFGSGETTNTGGQVYEALIRRMLRQQAAGPLQISVLETPAGFEANAERVAGRVSDYLATRLSNYRPHIRQIAARKKGTLHSPDAPEVVDPLYESSLIFLGPGSPTYAVRQLRDSLAWQILQARHRLGGAVVFASAATIAAGALALPVYEIFKVGEDPHWKTGLDFLHVFGLSLVIVPHWNNNDGGSELDTSRCFIGQARFADLLSQLPDEQTVLGIDEHTAVTIDFEARLCRVAGVGSVHRLAAGAQTDYATGSEFPLQALGAYRPLAEPADGLRREVWQKARQAADRLAALGSNKDRDDVGAAEKLPKELQALVAERETARQQRDWARADQLRDEIAALGWKVADSPGGPLVTPL